MLKKVYRPLRAFHAVDRRLRGAVVPCVDRKVFNRVYKSNMVVAGYTILSRENDEDDVLIFPGKKERSFAVMQRMPGNVSVRCYVVVSDTEAVAICSLVTKRRGAVAAGCLALAVAVSFGVMKVLPVIKDALKPEAGMADNNADESLYDTEGAVAEFYSPEEQEENGSTGSIVSDLALLLDQDDSSKEDAESSSGEDSSTAAGSENVGNEDGSSAAGIDPEAGDAEAPKDGHYEREADWVDVDAYQAGMTEDEVSEAEDFKENAAFVPLFTHLTVTAGEPAITVKNTNRSSAVKLVFSGAVDNEVEIAPGKSEEIEVYSRAEDGKYSIAYLCSIIGKSGETVSEFNSTVSVTVKK